MSICMYVFLGKEFIVINQIINDNSDTKWLIKLAMNILKVSLDSG